MSESTIIERLEKVKNILDQCYHPGCVKELDEIITDLKLDKTIKKELSNTRYSSKAFIGPYKKD